ncbi:LysR family transcriptional regulator [Streptomyces sp. MBT27]|uniref:LysR family transcriptional regulator n=1 Tax=Streptomyces sp. MBT27 TaxID=1488356 RepID=UPI001F072A37|nr:LysR family transcriptional regulator [Streptomyces sp. MBT27]
MRDIEIFLALAEELHFGRTAERLHVTAGRVSQSIRRTERLIGAPLFDRTTRTVRLTRLGERFRQDLAVGHRHIADAVRTAQHMARGSTGTLTLGIVGPMLQTLAAALDLFRARHPEVVLGFREVQPASALDPLRDGDVDLALLWLPIDEPDLSLGPVLHRTDLLLMTATSHPFARRESICLEDLADVPLVRGTTVPAYTSAAIAPYRTPSGRRVPDGPQVTTMQEVMTVVASGQTGAGVTSDVPRAFPWPGLAFIPVRDAPRVDWALAWRTGDNNPLTRAFTQAATETAPPGSTTPSGG